jgi:hypothetical protein
MTVGRSSDHGPILVVPGRPGPLVPLAPDVGQRDDLDDLLDEIFGEPLPDGPGVADAVLLLLGGTGLALGLLGALGTWAVVVGAVTMALGLVLPLRALATAARRRRAARAVADVLVTGTPLDVSDPLTAALAHRYADLLAESDLGGPSGEDARHLAHQTVLEVATLLRGQPPQGAAEREFVRTREEALGGLTADLARARQDTSVLDAAVEAVERVDELNGSVPRIEALRRSLGGDES